MTPGGPADATPGPGATAPLGTAPELSPRIPVHELVHQQALSQPHAPAMDDLSYEELDSWAGRIARSLAENGVSPGRPVAVRLSAGAYHVAALLGVLKAGCFLVPLSPNDPVIRCMQVLQEIQPAGLLVAPGSDADELTSWYRASASGPVLPVLTQDDARLEPLTATRPDEEDLDGAAYVVYTSGSTGQPKGVAQSHRALAQLALWMGMEFRMGPGRRTAQWAAPHYDASICEVFATLIAGGTLCPVPDGIRFDAGKVADWLAGQQINLFQTVPSFGRELLHAVNSSLPAADLPTLDHLLFAGEPLPGDLATGMAAAIPGVRLINLYGPTETILATWMEVNGKWAGTVPIGQPIPGRSILVLDPADRPCPVGATGEIVICSPLLTLGYVGTAPSSGPRYDTIALTAINGTPSTIRCYRTGDQGRWRTDDVLEFRGRQDRQVKLRGIRVELDDIEAALTSHPSVIDCVVVPQGDRGELIQQLVAYVVPTSVPGSPQTWRSHLRQRLGEQMVPSTFVTLSALPRNAGGKVDTTALPAPSHANKATKGRTGKGSRAASFRSWSAALEQHPDTDGQETQPS
ncbi:amino acid adenylation domain-containing protein [Streptomyces mirabilis]|uniref:Amino acid adenylation domain-containing protein n=1 Tax=Streptomyces mirabilis TaxID=68239 RepID=A0ABU3V5Y2_9ACTN|nr:amino acid adenylation domain-containing protein [Streptomyces mirabilis]MCX5357045.1 amino acid adenylation domain-containing protein [Streptomyces mirabilis]MDU9001582.1 amino acid adenylation domain-containing protein [Streptomyces mirabilis]